MSVFKHILQNLVFFASLMWVLVSGMSMAFIGMCEGTIELKAKPMWFILLAVALTSLSAFNILWFQMASVPELKRRK